MTAHAGRPQATSDESVPHSRDIVAVPMAAFLWAVVVLGLAYGVIQTLDKVVALFS